MVKFTLDMSRPATLSPETQARFEAMREDEIEAMAFDPDFPATSDAELDQALAARRFRSIRSKHRLSEDAFSRILHVPVGMVRDWEEGRRMPDAAALALLTVFDNEPEAFARAFRKEEAAA